MLKDAIKAFLELKQQEAIFSAESGKKVSKLTIGRVLYAAQDYFVAGMLGSMVIWMETRGISIAWIFLATWTFDTVSAYWFFRFGDSSGYDITLGQSIRRAVDVLFKNGIGGKILGVGFSLWTCLKAIAWEGPETICFLFQKELNTRVRFHVTMVALSFIQAIFGTWLYTTGLKMWEAAGFPEPESYQIFLLSVAIFVVFTAVVVIIKKLAQWVALLIRKFRT